LCLLLRRDHRCCEVTSSVGGRHQPRCFLGLVSGGSRRGCRRLAADFGRRVWRSGAVSVAGGPGSSPEKMVLLVVGTGGASRSGLGDGDAELVYAGEDGERFRGMLSKVENLVPAAAHEGRGDLEQPGAESFGLPLP